MEHLKHLGRYLLGRKRVETRFHRQRRSKSHLRTYTDSDWAGDVGNRKSTTGLIVLRGNHLLRHTSSLQATVALSSAEAEFYAMTQGAAYTLGTQSYFRDWQVELTIACYSDASSGLSFASRRGLGRMRHVETRFLWLQERVALKHLRVTKVGTDDNPSDMLTKQLTPAKFVAFGESVGEYEIQSSKSGALSALGNVGQRCATG